MKNSMIRTSSKASLLVLICSMVVLGLGCESKPKPDTSAHPAVTPSPRMDVAEAMSQQADVVPKLRRDIEALKDDLPGRLRARQGLVQAFCHQGDESAIRTELAALINDAVQNAGEQVAEDVAMNAAMAARRKKSPRSAEFVLRQILERFSESKDRVRMWIQIGECQLSQNHYRQAEETYRQLVEDHDGHAAASWAWRRLALAQTLQSHFDDALATLDIMADKYAGVDAGEYAESRKPYVLNLAGRKAEAKHAYEDFLANNEASAYRELAASQLKALDVETRLAGIQP